MSEIEATKDVTECVGVGEASAGRHMRSVNEVPPLIPGKRDGVTSRTGLTATSIRARAWPGGSGGAIAAKSSPTLLQVISNLRTTPESLPRQGVISFQEAWVLHLAMGATWSWR